MQKKSAGFHHMHLRFATTFTNYGKPTLNTQVSVGKFARSLSEVAIRGANEQICLALFAECRGKDKYFILNNQTKDEKLKKWR